VLWVRGFKGSESGVWTVYFFVCIVYISFPVVLVWRRASYFFVRMEFLVVEWVVVCVIGVCGDLAVLWVCEGVCGDAFRVLPSGLTLFLSIL